MTIEITNQVRIQSSEHYWYTVEDTNIDVGCDGCTISYWHIPPGVNTTEERVIHISINEDEALAIADAIYKFFKK
jgi:hypothetical protein